MSTGRRVPRAALLQAAYDLSRLPTDTVVDCTGPASVVSCNNASTDLGHE